MKPNLSGALSAGLLALACAMSGAAAAQTQATEDDEVVWQTEASAAQPFEEAHLNDNAADDDDETESSANQPRLAAKAARGILTGKRVLACVGVHYSTPNNNYVTASKCKKLADRVARFYNINSRGKFQLQTIGTTIDVDYPGVIGNVGRAEAEVKRQVKADYYIVPNVWRKGGNHASGRIAHMSQILGWLAAHEVGHLLRLGHTGKYLYQDGKPVKLEHYGDTDSVMSRTGAPYLTAPQYLVKGWLPPEEVATFDPAYPAEQIFELKQIGNFKGEGLSIVRIPPELLHKNGEARPAFVAYPYQCQQKACAALYLGGASTQKVANVQDEFFDAAFTNLKIKVLGEYNNKVRISISLVPKS